MEVKETNREEILISETEIKEIVARFIESEMGWESGRVDLRKLGQGMARAMVAPGPDDEWCWQYVEIDGVTP